MSNPPLLSGFAPMALADPFEIHVGPVFEKNMPGGRCFAIRVDERHVNRAGVLHGGMLATFADLALGAAVWEAMGKIPCVTLSMQMQFLKSARAGDVVHVQPQVLRRTQSFMFMRGDFVAGEEVIFTAMSTWKRLERNSGDLRGNS
ncbi:MAG TPA: PaaI family thioesterase [Rhizomicrobium sp.]|jgi:uncharacterized protein (TIGR00369 family)